MYFGGLGSGGCFAGSGLRISCIRMIGRIQQFRSFIIQERRFNFQIVDPQQRAHSSSPLSQSQVQNNKKNHYSKSLRQKNINIYNNNAQHPIDRQKMLNKETTSSKLQDIVQMSMHNLASNSKSNTKFIIRYEEKQSNVVKSVSKNNRYSSKYEHDMIRNKKISQSVLQKTRHKNADGSGVPSYLRPTQASISAQLERNRIASVAEFNNENKIGTNIKMRSKSLEGEEERDAQREYNRVPIQFYDEKSYGCGADFLRARVVFRGYAPKNTYYYLKTLKPFKRKPKRSFHNLAQSPSFSLEQSSLPKGHVSSISTMNVMKSDMDIRFQSKFQSGNLSAASRINTNEYWLYMREDTNTHGLRQWFYFVATNKKPIKIKFRIYKFTKSYSLYKMGMKPYIRTATFDTNSNPVPNQWQQGGEKVKYEFDAVQRCFFLEFQFLFQEENQEVQFAMLPPYTYSMLKDYLRSVQTFQDPINGQIETQSPRKFKIEVTTIGQTLAGLDIPFLQIRKALDKNQFQGKCREAIVVLARTHPGQTVSNFSLQSFIDSILHSDDIIEHFDFFILPMVNPDGVYFGNHRTSIIGQDLNRNFNTNDFEVFPEIEAVHNAVNRARRSHKIRFLLDLHGHSARKNIFAYGQQEELNSQAYLHTRILPKLLSNALSSFKYDYCIFREAKQKKNTARVYYTNKYKLNCLTFQQSYGIVQDGPIGIHVWRNFGVALMESLREFVRIYQGKERALEEYLAEETEKERIVLEKRIQKHKKMLGIDDEHFFSLYSTTIGRNGKTKGQNSIQISKTTPHEEKQPENLNQTARELIEIDPETEKKQQFKIQQQEQQQQKSVSNSELSSGDESLELMPQQIESIKKQILKIGCMREGLKRQKYNIADKKLQLYDTRQYESREEVLTVRRLHEQKSSMIPRIAKLQLKRKEEYNLSIKREVKEDRREVIEKDRLERRREIQAKFRRMELPAIKK